MSERLPISSLLRAGADDDLTPEQARALAEHLRAHPEDEECMGFEKDLRAACGRVMADVPVPPDLRARIEAAVRAEHDAEPTLSGGLHRLSHRTRARSFWARAGLPWVAAAAVLVIAAVMGFQYLVIGRAHANPLIAAANFTMREHTRCDSNPAATEAKFAAATPDEIPPLAEKIFGRPLDEALLDESLVLIKAGRCRVPGKGPSIHVQLALAGAPGEVYSLFIQRDDGEAEMDDGVTYVCTPTIEMRLCPVVAWRRDGMNYFLVCPEDAARQQVREMLRAPEVTRRV